MMSINALWTAACYRIPALFVIANNRSYYNDEVHQENVARARSRNLDNKRIGISIDRWVAQTLSETRPRLGIAAVI